MEAKMKAMMIEKFGGPEELKWMDVSIPPMSDHEIQIQISYAGVNPIDWKMREGLLKSRLPFEFPLILGCDLSGTVIAVGKKVHKFINGDQVFAYCRKPTFKWGTYAESVTLDPNQAALKPKILTFAQAAAIPLTSLTAWQALFEEGKLKKDDVILIHAGAGGVGGFAIQFAKMTGATIYTTASKQHHVYVSKLGADVAIDYNDQSFEKVIKQEHPKGIDLVLDSIGGDTLQKSLEVIKPGGRLVSLVEQLDPSLTISRGIKGGFIYVRPDGRLLNEIGLLIKEGKIIAPHIEEFPLADAAKAQEKVRAGHTKGKIVLKIH